jgi:hypothetical protein
MRITLGRPHLSLEIDAYRRKQKKNNGSEKRIPKFRAIED